MDLVDFLNTGCHRPSICLKKKKKQYLSGVFDGEAAVEVGCSVWIWTGHILRVNPEGHPNEVYVLL